MQLRQLLLAPRQQGSNDEMLQTLLHSAWAPWEERCRRNKQENSRTHVMGEAIHVSGWSDRTQCPDLFRKRPIVKRIIKYYHHHRRRRWHQKSDVTQDCGVLRMRRRRQSNEKRKMKNEILWRGMGDSSSIRACADAETIAIVKVFWSTGASHFLCRILRGSHRLSYFCKVKSIFTATIRIRFEILRILRFLTIFNES